MLLYIIRHGDPDYKTDTLTERGRAQAEAVALRMQRSGITQVYSSPMGRAKETAAPTCRLLSLPCHIEDWAHEIEEERITHFPDGKRKSVTDLQNTYYRENGAIDLPYDRTMEAPGFSDTEMDKAAARIAEGGRDFLRRLGYEEEGGIYRITAPSDARVALFCHSAMSRAWLSTLLHIPLHLMWAGFHYTHTGVTVLEFKNYKNGVTAPRCLVYSDMSHLFAAGLDMRHNGSKEGI